MSIDTQKFLDLYKTRILGMNFFYGEKQPIIERALFSLLTAFQEELPPMDDYFHKAFRQIDVITSFEKGGHVDSAIWDLISESKVFWEVWGELNARDENASS